MVPILYATITEGTVPSDYGLGALTDCLECYVNEERNGSYELELTYAAQGIHAEDIQVDRYIKAKPNYTDNPQIFRIYKVGKNINGRFTVNAQHISYDLSGKVIKNGTANNIATACSVLQAQAGNYTINTTKSTLGDFTITEPSSVRSWFGGKQGSLLDVYGGGEWHFNNFVCTLAQHRGTDRKVTIRYGKNLTELNQTIDASGLYTHVLSYYQKEGVTVSGNEIATGLSGDKKVLILDASNDFETEPDQTDLDNYSTAYIAGHPGLATPSVNFTLNFVQTGELSERVDLCDTVHVYFEPLGINATVKCIRVKWDVLEGRYIETEFGDPKTNITDTITGNDAAIAQANANAEAAMNAVGSKKRVFISTPVPPYDEGDLWVDNGTIYVCINPRAQTDTQSQSGAIVDFETYIGGNLLACEVEIEGTQSGTGTPSPGNPRPLTVFDEANVTMSGVNVLNNTVTSWHSNNVYYTVNEDLSISLTGTASATTFISLSSPYYLPAGTYTMSQSGHTGIQILLRKNNISGADVFPYNEHTDRTATITAGNYVGLIRIGSGTVTDGITLYPQMQLGNEAVSYLPYVSTTDTTSFEAAGKIYKGTLNALTGQLDVTWAYIESYNGETITEPWVSSIDEYIPNGTPSTGAQVAYELAAPVTYNLTPQEIIAAVGKNVIYADTGDINITYNVGGFTPDDWQLATDYVDNTELEDTIASATSLITGVTGGLVILHDTNGDGAPDEIIITNDNDFNSNTARLWRWNSAGLGYSKSGYAGPYETAISIDENGNGQINASLITTGTLNASLVHIQDLTAAMFNGQTIVLGGADNAKLEVQDSSNPPNTLIRINGNGLECFGETVGGVTPSVVFDKNGVTGYADSSDKENSAIFWTHEQDFHMKNAVVENEASFGSKIRFVPMNTGTNNGIAIVAAV